MADEDEKDVEVVEEDDDGGVVIDTLYDENWNPIEIILTEIPEYLTAGGEGLTDAQAQALLATNPETGALQYITARMPDGSIVQLTPEQLQSEGWSPEYVKEVVTVLAIENALRANGVSQGTLGRPEVQDRIVREAQRIIEEGGRASSPALQTLIQRSTIQQPPPARMPSPEPAMTVGDIQGVLHSAQNLDRAQYDTELAYREAALANLQGLASEYERQIQRGLFDPLKPADEVGYAKSRVWDEYEHTKSRIEQLRQGSPERGVFGAENMRIDQQAQASATLPLTPQKSPLDKQYDTLVQRAKKKTRVVGI